MSSSLLLVLIVVVWLFVLAPLVINRREPIRRTSEALGKTRVLHRGGEELASSRRRPSFTADDVRKSDDADESLETVDAHIDEDSSVDDVLYDDTKSGREQEQAAPDVVEGDVVWELEQAADDLDDDAVDREVVEAVEANSEAEVEPAGDTEAEIAVASQQEDAPVEDEDAGDAHAERIEADAAGDTVVSAVASRQVFVDEDDLMFGDEPVEESQVARAVEDATEDEVVAEGVEVESADTAEADADLTTEVAADDELDDTLTEDDYAFAERRRGRGGFDPVSDAHYAKTRFARRRRSVAGLVGFTLVTLIVGIVVGGWTWWLPLVGAGLLAVYLVYLRRTVRAEDELRRRRIRRMKLARQGVRNIEDDELGIPQRLRRPGAVVVELDDEDPVFADLPYGEYEPHYDDDLRRVAG